MKLALAAGLACLVGCGGDDGPGARFGPGGGADTAQATGDVVEFFDDFSGSFPSPNWEIKKGAPWAIPIVGNAAPGLCMKPYGHSIRVRSEMEFSTADPLTLSFDLAAYDLQHSSRFKFKLRRMDADGGSASFEVRNDDDEIRVRIAGADEDIDFNFVPDGHYHAIEFTLDENGAAAWWMNGTLLMTAGGFPAGTYAIEIETSGGDRTKFIVDNVKLTRP
jgi:hypothetical protein